MVVVRSGRVPILLAREECLLAIAEQVWHFLAHTLCHECINTRTSLCHQRPLASIKWLVSSACTSNILCCIFYLAALSALRLELSSVPRVYQHAATYRFVISERLPVSHGLCHQRTQAIFFVVFFIQLHYLRLGLS